MPLNSRWVLSAALIVAHSGAPRLCAQWQSNTGPDGAALGAIVGGDVERYVRALSVAGLIRHRPWAVRPFSPADLIDLMTDSASHDHPWYARLQQVHPTRAAIGAVGFASANSGMPWGANDGALWQGRGVTTALGLSATFTWGPLTAIAAPVLFSAQNASFPLLKPVLAGVPSYLDPLLPQAVDLPQRMGTRRYARVDAGESTIRLAGFGAVLGVSTASLGWGGGESFPAILGANGGGFPHLFLGTRGRGAYLRGFGRFSGRYVLGMIPQSDFSPVQGSASYVDRTESGTERVGVGVNVSFMPDALPGLELGVQRFYHSPNRSGNSRWEAWSKPFEALYKSKFEGRTGGAGDPGGDTDNQLAAFVVRWVLPKRGVEAHFELLREDHSWDARDLAQEPENNSAVMASIRAITHRDASRLSVLTLEYFDGDVRPIAQARAQSFLYANSLLRQGHTVRGQLLGAPMGAGAVAGERVAWERFTRTGSRRYALQRWRTRGLPSDDAEQLYRQPGQPAPDNHDYIIDGSVAETRYRRGHAVTVEGGIAWAGTWQFGSSRTNAYMRASWSLF